MKDLNQAANPQEEMKNLKLRLIPAVRQYGKYFQGLGDLYGKNESLIRDLCAMAHRYNELAGTKVFC